MLILCSRCGKVVTLNVFKYQCCVMCACFLSYVFDVYNSPVATPAHGLLGLSPSLRLRFILQNVSLLASYVCAATHGPTSLLRLLGLSSLGFSYIFVACLVVRVHVTGDLNRTISFVVGVLTTSLACVLFGLIH